MRKRSKRWRDVELPALVGEPEVLGARHGEFRDDTTELRFEASTSERRASPSSRHSRESTEDGMDPESEILERELLARGLRERRACIKAPGMLSLKQAATVSGITMPTLRRMRSSGRLLALPLHGLKKGYRYPAWQFEPEIMRALPPILTAFGTGRMWQAYDFLIHPEPLLAGCVPLEEIRAGRSSSVLRIAPAASASEQGGY